MSGINTIDFVVFAIVASLFSMGAVRAAHFFYSKIIVCHPSPLHIKWGEYDKCDILDKAEEPEGLFSKVSKLYFYNLAIVLTTLLVLLIYQNGPIGSGLDINIQNMFAIITMVLILNFSVRVTSLADLDLTSEYYEDIEDRSLSFGYSFLLTLYFLAILGLGSHVFQSSFDILVNGGFEASAQVVRKFLLLVFIGPVVSSILSELALLPPFFGVKQDSFN
jgi:hypothetical protein